MAESNKPWYMQIRYWLVVMLVSLMLAITLPIIGWTIYKKWETNKIERLFNQACEEYGGYEVYEQVFASESMYKADGSGAEYINVDSIEFKKEYSFDFEREVFSDLGPVYIFKTSIFRKIDGKLLAFSKTVSAFGGKEIVMQDKGSSAKYRCFNSYEDSNFSYSDSQWITKKTFIKELNK